MTDPDEPKENPPPKKTFSVDLRNWAMNPIRSPVEVAEILPEISLLPETFFSHSSFLETDGASELEVAGENPDTLQGLSDWLFGTDISYLNFQSSKLAFLPDLSEPLLGETPPKLPTVATKVTNLCLQKFPQFRVQRGVSRTVPAPRDPHAIFEDALTPDPDYNLSEGVVDAVAKLLLKELLPEPSALPDFEIRRPAETVAPPTSAEPIRTKGAKAPQSTKEVTLRQLSRFLQGVVDQADEMQPDQATDPTQDLVLCDGGDKFLSAFTVSKIEKLVVKAIGENALDMVAKDLMGCLYRLLQTTVHYGEAKSIFHSGDARTKERVELDCLAIEAAMASARLALQMANHLSDSKPLYNETLISSSLNLVRHQIDHSILPALDVFAETAKKPADEQAEAHAFVKKNASRLCKLALNISGFAQDFGGFLKTTQLVYSIITSLVFTCLIALFSELVRGNKIAIFSSGASVNFKRQFQSVLQTIFVLYPEQRSLVVEEVINSLINLPADKRSHKSFRLLDTKSIHIATAIVLQLSQSCAELAISKALLDSSDYSRLQGESFSTASASFTPVVNLFISGCRAGVEDSNRVIGPVLQFLLTRASKGKGPNEVEYRHILDTMLEDSLEILNLPEWPAAETFLHGLCIRLFKIVDEGNDPALKSLAIEYLGTIASRIKKYTPEALTSRYDECSADMESSDLINTLSQMPEELGVDTSSLVLKSLWASFERLARYLKAVASEDPTYECARQLLFCDWGQYLGQACVALAASNADPQRDKDAQAYLRACLSKIIKQACSKDVLDSLVVTEQLKAPNRGMVCALSEVAACRSKLFKNFDPILARILKFLESSSLAHRSKAVKALTAILKEFPDIVSVVRVQQSMRLRLQDTSAMVRIAAVDFIGRCMTAHREISQEYYADISQRILDTSVSIRQRVIKILREISKTADPATLADICCKILMRTQDGEVKVQQLALASLQSIWFSPLEGHELPADCEALLKDSQHLRLDSLSPVCQQQMKGRATTIIDVVTSLATTLHNDALVSDFISKSLEKPPEPRSEATLRHWSICSVIGRLLMDCFFHHLVLLDRSSDKEAINNTLKALVAFGTTGGLLIPTMHLTTLFPYLSFSHEVLDQKTMHLALRIYNFTLPRLENPNVPLLKKVEDLILGHISKIGLSVLNEAIPCFCRVAAIGDPKRPSVSRVLKGCLGTLTNARHPPRDGQPPLADKSIGRLLILLGLVGQNIDLNGTVPGLPKLLETEEQVDRIFECMFHFMGSASDIIRAAAMQGLGNLSLAYPKLLLRVEYRTALLEALRSNDRLTKAKLLNFLISYLNQNATKPPTEESTSSRGPSDQQLAGATANLGDAGICSSIVQTLLEAIIECVLSEPLDIQSLCLQLIGLVLEQGHVNPLECVAVLVALQTESNRHLSTLAGDIYSKMVGKFSKLIYSRNVEALQYTFRYHRRRNPGIIPRGYRITTDTELPRALLHFMYQSAKSSRAQKQEFFKTIFNFFDLEATQLKAERELLKFLAENVVAFDFQTPEEVHEILVLVARAIVPGESSLQVLEAKSNHGKAMSRERATLVADATSLLLILKHSLLSQYGLTNLKAYKEKALTRHEFNGTPWDNFEFAQNSGNRLRILLDRDLTVFQPDEKLFREMSSKPRSASSAKKFKGPSKPTKAAPTAEEDISDFAEDSSEEESEEDEIDVEA